MNVLEQVIENKYAIYNGDSCEIVRAIPDNSIHYTIFSPPFASLYTYSNHDKIYKKLKNAWELPKKLTEEEKHQNEEFERYFS